MSFLYPKFIYCMNEDMIMSWGPAIHLWPRMDCLLFNKAEAKVAFHSGSPLQAVVFIMVMLERLHTPS